MRHASAVLLAASCLAVSSVEGAWTCDQSYFNANDGCDCACGEWDPDCDLANQQLYCEGGADSQGRVCNKDTLACEAPSTATFTCNQAYYNANDGCDCDCGAWDPDCDRSGQTLYCDGSPDTLGRTCSASTLTCESGSSGAQIFGLRVTANLAAHATSQFYTTAGFTTSDVLVLRRGQTFEVELVGAAPASFTAALGGVALTATATSATVWAVAVPATADVGRFTLTLNGESYGTVAVLFNPYKAADTQTYVADAAERAEYLENENGRYWYGDVYSETLGQGAGSSAWAFGQYDVLNYVMELVSRMPSSVDRSSAVEVSRAMTYLLNSGVSQGVLQGRWDGNYAGGTAPWVWTGSRDILKAWSDANHASVKYGQCWVFACLLTTTMRTLGVAARPITNFRSAHEAKPFDFYIDERTADSIWNFHAWVDAKMSRPDISSAANYVQWNAIDATPQEYSDGKYQMGPASLPQMADNVAHGSSYDQTFVVSETNGIVIRNGQYIYSDVGRYISTKQPGCTGSGHTCRMDITTEYKKHDSPLTTEREASALGKGSRMTSRRYDDLAGFALKAGSLAAGGDVQFHAVSTGGVKLNGGRGGAQAVFVVEAVSYTGVKIADLDVALAVVSPNGKAASIVVPEAVYAPFLAKTNTLRVTLEVRNMIGMVMYSHANKFELATPNPVATLLKDGTATVSFTNPLAIALTHCFVHYSTPSKDETHKMGTIAAHATKTIVVPTARWCNREKGTQKEVVFSFMSNELAGTMHTDLTIEC